MRTAHPLNASAKIIAHRGASHDAPENTVSAALLAWKQEADGLEMDIHLTADGHPVVIHDPTLARTTGGSGRVEEMLLAQLKGLDAGKWKSDRFADEKIPVLEEMLGTVPAGKRAVVEIKTKRDVSMQVERAVTNAGLAEDQLTLIAFDYNVLQKLKAVFPHYEALWLIGDRHVRGQSAVDATLKEIFKQSHDAGFEGLNMWHGWPVDSVFVEAIHGAGLKLGVWTVDDADFGRSLAEAGVDYITTNRPDWIRMHLKPTKIN